MLRHVQRARLRHLADIVESYPEEYNQAHYCHTALCVAGWAVWEYGTEKERTAMDTQLKIGYPVGRQIEFFARGRQILDLTHAEAIHLFDSSPDWDSTPKGAAQLLRTFARTGRMPA